MTQHEITARAHYWAVSTIAAVALVAIVAGTQHQDAADDQAARAHVEQQRTGGAR